MSKHVGSRSRGGAPVKAPGGLNRALFIRVDDALFEALDILVKEQRRARPGLSRSDVVRKLVHEAVNKIRKKKR